MLTAGKKIIGKAIDVDYIGQGIVKYNDVVVFVKGMLLDEVAEIEIKQVKSRFAEGKVIKIIEKSPDRREHPSAHLGSMDLVHMSDDAQLMWQTKLTGNTLKKIADISFPIDSILTDHHTFHYRNKSVFHVMYKERLTLGLYHEDGRGLIAIDTFDLADDVTNRIIKKIHASKIVCDSRSLKQIAIRTNDKQQALVTLVATSDRFEGLDQLVKVISSMDEVVGITLNIKDDQRRILGKTSKTLYGSHTIELRIKNDVYPVTDQAFFQVNTNVIQMAYDVIRQDIKPNQTVIDAYSGVGSIGYYIRDLAKKIIMIESNRDAVSMAQAIKEKEGISNVEIILGYAEKMIHEIQADVIIVDPPRNGLMPELVTHMIEKKFEQIFYLSCDLKTLSRDLKLLTQRYDIQKVVPIRMFPQTTECETLVILKQQKNA